MVAVVVAAVAAWVDAPGSIRARGFRWLLDRRLAAVLTAPLGLLGYLGWVAYETGDLDGYFDVTQGWGNDFDGGIAFGTWIVGHLVGTTTLVGLAVLAVWLYSSAWWCSVYGSDYQCRCWSTP